MEHLFWGHPGISMGIYHVVRFDQVPLIEILLANIIFSQCNSSMFLENFTEKLQTFEMKEIISITILFYVLLSLK